MTIENLKDVARTNYQTAKVGHRGSQVDTAFSEALKKRQGDTITISQQTEVVSGIDYSKYSYEDDPYNVGEPTSLAAEEVLKVLAHLRETADSFDYTGMNDEEIYRVIYTRYDKALEKWGGVMGALDIYIEEGPGSRRTIDTTSQMGDEFIQNASEEIAQKYAKKNADFIQKFRAEALYGHMTKEERLEYITKKYPVEGQTVQEYCSFLAELANAELITREAANNLSSNARIRLDSFAITEDASYCSEAYFERLVYLSGTVRDTIENRFSKFEASLLRIEDQAKYDDFLNEVLMMLSKYR